MSPLRRRLAWCAAATRAAVRLALVPVLITLVGARELAAAGACDVPSDAISIFPGQEVQSAVDAHPPGAVFVLRAGTHWRQSIRPRAGNAFHGERGPACQRLAVLNGAHRLTRFEATSHGFAAEGQTHEGQVHGVCDPGFERCDRPEDLFYDGVPLRHVSRLAQLVPGSWFFDYARNTVHLADPPSGHRVEIGVARSAFAPSSPDVLIRGLVIEKYASPAQMGAIGDQIPAPGWRVEDCEIRLNHGVGVMLGSGSRVLDSHVHHNGQLGVGGQGAKLRIERNELAHNGYAGMDASWEAGGAKFNATRGLVLAGNCVHHNRGPGLWTDTDNLDARIEANDVFHNVDAGIFHEVSGRAWIRGNRVGRNGRRDPWLWGSNILLATSRDVEVSGNYVEVDPEYGHGISIVAQDRSEMREFGGSIVHHNELTFLGSRGLGGAARDFPEGVGVFTGNRFRANRYHVPDPSKPHFEWADTELDWTAFRAAGQEESGAIDDIVQPRTWRCSPTDASRR